MLYVLYGGLFLIVGVAVIGALIGFLPNKALGKLQEKTLNAREPRDKNP